MKKPHEQSFQPASADEPAGTAATTGFPTIPTVERELIIRLRLNDVYLDGNRLIKDLQSRLGREPLSDADAEQARLANNSYHLLRTLRGFIKQCSHQELGCVTLLDPSQAFYLQDGKVLDNADYINSCEFAADKFSTFLLTLLGLLLFQATSDELAAMLENFKRSTRLQIDNLRAELKAQVEKGVEGGEAQGEEENLLGSLGIKKVRVN